MCGESEVVRAKQEFGLKIRPTNSKTRNLGWFKVLMPLGVVVVVVVVVRRVSVQSFVVDAMLTMFFRM